MTIRLTSFKAPTQEGGFIIPASLSREIMQFGSRVPGITTPVKVGKNRVTMLRRWGLISLNSFGTTFTVTRFGRVVFKHATANGASVLLPYEIFLSYFVNGYRSTSPRERGIKQAILAHNAAFFEDVPEDIQFLYTVGFFNDRDVRAYDMQPDPDDEFDIL